MDGNDLDKIQDIINKRDRLTKDDIREVVREEFVRIGISAKTDAEAVRTQAAFGFLFRLSRAANSALTKIITGIIIAAIAIGALIAADIFKIK